MNINKPKVVMVSQSRIQEMLKQGLILRPPQPSLAGSSQPQPQPQPEPQPSRPAEEKCSWKEEEIKLLIETVMKKRDGKVTHILDVKFWRQVAEETPGIPWNPEQCQTKWGNLLRGYSRKTTASHSTGGPPLNLNTCEKFLYEEIAKLSPRTAFMIPEGQVVAEDIDITPSSSSSTQGANVEPSQLTPHRKKKKVPHGTGSNQAGARSNLQAAFLHFLNKSDERKEARTSYELKRVAVMEEHMQLQKDKLKMRKAELEFKKSKLLEKQKENRNKLEMKRKLVEVEEEKVKLLNLLRENQLSL